MMKEKIEISGSVKNIVFRSEQNGYTVFKIQTGKHEIICTGYFAQINENENISVSGNFVVHPTYGEQFKVTSIEKKIPVTENNIEKYLSSVVSQLDNLLRIPGIKGILCNRTNNLDFDKMLANSEVNFVCTRRGDLGAAGHKAFGLFFLIAMQNAVLRRPGIENSRVPHFLYIDEFSDFICKETEAIFTMYRKYKVGTVISTQNLQQLETPSLGVSYKNTILGNCASKIFTGNGPYDELEWWSGEFGQKREWSYSNSMDMEKMKYDSKYGSVEWKFTPYFKPGKLQSLGAKDCAYKIRGSGGKPMAGVGRLCFLESKYKEPHKSKTYNSEKYSNGYSSDDSEDSKPEKFDYKHVNFKDARNEIDPIQTDTTDSGYIFDNDDAIVVNLKKKK